MDILATLPKTPGMAPEALWAWLKRNGRVHPQELIRYKTTKLADPLTGIREKYAACNCTACGESWHTTIALPGEGGAYPYFDTEEGPRRNGETIHCPNCGTAALVAHEKRLDRWPIVKKAYPWEIRKAGGCVMFICWAVIHETGYDWESTIAEQRNAYVIDPGGHWHRFTAMDRSGYSSMSTMYYTGRWYETRRFQVADGNFSAILPHAADVYEGTQLENTIPPRGCCIGCTKSPPTRCGRTPKATRPKSPKTKRWQSAARAPKMKPPEAESWLHETAALLIDAMDLAAKQQRRLDLHADSKTKDEYTALLARYERFTQAADK